MLPKAIAVAVLSSIALVVSGCGGGSDAEAESPVDIAQLRADLKERWAAPPNEVAPVWYQHVKAINWANGYVEVKTDFTPEEISASGTPSPCVEIYNVASEQLEEPVEPALVVAVFDAGGVRQGSCG